jgi:anti-sigma B factor antagonist
MLIDFEFHDDGVCILRLKGRFITGGDVAYLRAKTEELKASGCRKAVADFTDVPYLDSTGIGFLVHTYTTMKKAGGQFVLASLNRRVRQVLKLTKLADIFPSYEDVQSALAALAASAEGKTAGA